MNVVTPGLRLVHFSMMLLVLAGVTACSNDNNGNGGSGGSGGSGSFSPASPPADICSLLTLADIQTILPGASAGAPQAGPPDPADYWARDCKWAASDISAQAVELVVFGAKTKNGVQLLKLAARSGTTNTPVSGLGDEAHYWEQDTSDNGLWTISGAYSVDVTAYFITPFPTESQLEPLVRKALGEL